MRGEGGVGAGFFSLSFFDGSKRLAGRPAPAPNWRRATAAGESTTGQPPGASGPGRRGSLLCPRPLPQKRTRRSRRGHNGAPGRGRLRCRTGPGPGRRQAGVGQADQGSGDGHGVRGGEGERGGGRGVRALPAKKKTKARVCQRRNAGGEGRGARPPSRIIFRFWARARAPPAGPVVAVAAHTYASVPPFPTMHPMALSTAASATQAPAAARPRRARARAQSCSTLAAAPGRG